jgi:hypothetical protein
MQVPGVVIPTASGSLPKVHSQKIVHAARIGTVVRCAVTFVMSEYVMCHMTPARRNEASQYCAPSLDIVHTDRDRGAVRLDWLYYERLLLYLSTAWLNHTGRQAEVGGWGRRNTCCL